MLGLHINYVVIEVRTAGGVFSQKIPFVDGLNIVRAENTSGKSTCVNAIIYGLGLEGALGPMKKKPFPRSVYEVINSSKSNNDPFL